MLATQKHSAFARSFLVLVLMEFMAVFAWASDQPPREVRDLIELGFEKLAQVNITSVSKKEENLLDAAAAVYVVTQEDIRRSGAASIPEALRMVPGLQVARIDANKWAITSRGFNGRYASKLLVLMDGRSIYTPLFAGVYWEVQDTLLEDVDRIEVIRGPGATLWGANAVNGVINIITKKAGETQGGLATGGGGDEERGFGGLRYGGKLNGNASYRAYAKYFNRDSFVDESGKDGTDEWDQYRGGFRVDWDSSQDDSLTFQGDAYSGNAGQTMTQPALAPPYSRTFDGDINVSGENVLARWKRSFSSSSDMEIQLYYDNNEYGEEDVGRSDLDIFDLDFQHRFMLGERHQVIWGLGYRYIHGKFDSSFAVSFDPENRADHLFTAFLQDEIAIIHDRLHLIVGSKFEHNDYTGSEAQPNGRLVWTPDPRHTVWTAISRAVRTPSWSDHGIRINFLAFPGFDGSTVLSSLNGGRNFDSEELLAYELGYRLQPSDRLFFDLSTFYNVYNNLLTSEPGAPFYETTPAPAHLATPLRFGNKMDGETYGVEAAATWDVTEAWRLMAGYSWLNMDLNGA
ncbi:MAG: TonB-dependent receptor plug domain-containing protein [Nitrospinae bacterium]|nr:TonB-dependent receptor plug domain-containing protein [Nitrospinota bacterium]